MGRRFVDGLQAALCGSIVLLAFGLGPGQARAGTGALADVVAVAVRPHGGSNYTFSVTIRSPDTGWSAYADRIEVVDADGAVLGTRDLVHPHDDEQPFTRDVDGVQIPRGVQSVTVRARFKPGGYGGKTANVPLPNPDR